MKAKADDDRKSYTMIRDRNSLKKGEKKITNDEIIRLLKKLTNNANIRLLNMK